MNAITKTPDLFGQIETLDDGMIEVTYFGKTFLLDILDGKKVSLNQIYVGLGRPKGKSPMRFLDLDSTREYIDFLRKKLNTEKVGIIKTTRGKGGGATADWHLALSYAEWLSHDLHYLLQEVFKKQLEYERYPELALNDYRRKYVDRAKANGDSDDKVEARLKTFDSTVHFRKTLQEHGVSQYGRVFNAEYQGLFGKTAKELSEERGCKRPRDKMSELELGALWVAEIASRNAINENDIIGNKPCAETTKYFSTIFGRALKECEEKITA